MPSSDINSSAANIRGMLSPVSRLDNTPGETRSGAGAGDKLGDDRTDQREPTGDPHPAQEVRKRAVKLQLLEALPAGGAV